MGDGDYPGDMGSSGMGLGCLTVFGIAIIFMVLSWAFHHVFGYALNGD